MVTLFHIGKRGGSRGRKASDPIPATRTAGRVAGLHLVSTHDQVSLQTFVLPLLLGNSLWNGDSNETI